MVKYLILQNYNFIILFIIIKFSPIYKAKIIIFIIIIF